MTQKRRVGSISKSNQPRIVECIGTTAVLHRLIRHECLGSGSIFICLESGKDILSADYQLSVSRFGIRGVVVVVFLLVVVPLSSSGGALAVTDQPADSLGGVRWQAAEPVNNSSTVPQQENPNQVGEDGNTAALENWLRTRLGEGLEESSFQISQGQYEEAQEVLGGEYEDTLSKYIEVAGGTPDESDDGLARQLNETAQAQAEYAQTLSTYRATYEEYQTARENGNEERARQLARQLRDLSTDVKQLNGSLTTGYENISESTGVAFQNETAAATNTTQNVTEQTTSVVRTVFTPTTITAAAEPNGSFSSAIQITGHVTSTGTAPLNGSVRLNTPGQVVRSGLDANNSFTISYRPTAASTGRLVRNVTYVPDSNGTYLGSKTAIQTNVTQVTPTLHVTDPSSAVRYQEPAGVTGRVMVGKRAVPEAVVQLRFDGTVVGETRTTATGRYNVSTPLPANITPGTQQLTVRVGAPATALTQTENETTVSVTETATTLTLSTTRLGDAVAVTGHLQTIDNESVPAQSVALIHDGVVVQTVQTNASGRIATQIPLPETDSDNGSIQLTGAFTGRTTNLASTQATSSITLPQSGGVFGTGLPASLSLVVSAGILGLVGLGFALYRFRDDEELAEETAEPPLTEPATESPPTTPELEQRLDTASSALADHNVEHAVRSLYGAARIAYTADSEPARTHWEFFTEVRGDLSASECETLRKVTEAYEAVQFANTPPAQADIATLLGEVQADLDAELENRNLNPTASPSSE